MSFLNVDWFIYVLYIVFKANFLKAKIIVMPTKSEDKQALSPCIEFVNKGSGGLPHIQIPFSGYTYKDTHRQLYPYCT